MLSDLQQSSISCTFAVYGSYNHALSVVHRLVRELIADCFGPTFKTHVRCSMNIGHVVENATILPVLYFHLEKLRFCARSLYGCSLRASFFLLLLGGGGGGGVARSPVKEDARVRGGEREEEFSSSHSIDLRNLF